MEWSKLKNVILLMLAAVNLFLLVLVVYRDNRTFRLEQEAREDLIQILNENGISMEPGQFPKEASWPSLQVNWDRTQSYRIAEAILGHVTEKSQGSTTVYMGEQGSAVFYGDGTVLITLNAEQQYSSLQATQDQARAFLQQMGMKTSELERKDTENGKFSFGGVQQAEGYDMFNCPITVTYIEPGTVSIQGTCLLGEVKYSTIQQTTISVFTAITKLMQYEAKYPAGIKEIQKVQAGYLLPAVLADSVQLEPVWHIITDQGEYDVSGTAGTVKRSGTAK